MEKTPSGVGRFRKSRARLLGIPKPLRAIRLKCLDCTCHQPVEIRECRITSCPLWPYRMGRYPKSIIEAKAKDVLDG